MIEKSAFSIGEFCDRNSISEGFYFSLQKQSLGPRVMNVRNRQLITRYAQRDWQLECKRAAAAEIDPGLMSSRISLDEGNC